MKEKGLPIGEQLRTGLVEQHREIHCLFRLESCGSLGRAYSIHSGGKVLSYLEEVVLEGLAL